MYALGRFGIVLGLETIETILKGLGNPHKRFKSIHIAGTNGKGSVASALSTILSASGYRVGLYTSPHLVHFNERIMINTKPISDQRVVDAYTAVSHQDQGARKATFFELTTAMAFHEFAAHQVEWAVIETGMGGRLDATNIINPELSIITNISIEHKTYLGNTIAKIAGEKGGIIKEGKPVITGVRQKSAIQTLEKIAANQRSTLYRLGKDFKARKNKNQTFTYHGINEIMPNMETGLLGNYQVENASLTLAACELLKQNGVSLSLDKIREGLKTNIWPGRLETLSTHPRILVDGAHNLAAVKNLKRFLKESVEKEKLTLVIGILEDKPHKEMLRDLIPLAKKIILTKPDNQRSTPPEKLIETAKTLSEKIVVTQNIKDAMALALKETAPDETICIAGSLYLVGEVKALLAGIKIEKGSSF